MGLWELPDKKKTARRVDNFLTTQLERLAIQSGVNLSAVSFDAMPGKPSGNSKENAMMHRLEVKEAFDAILLTIKRKTYGIYPQILYKLYVKKEPAWQIQQELYIDHDTWRKEKEIALNQFADGWQNTTENWDPEDKIDLHVFDQGDEK